MNTIVSSFDVSEEAMGRNIYDFPGTMTEAFRITLVKYVILAMASHKLLNNDFSCGLCRFFSDGCYTRSGVACPAWVSGLAKIGCSDGDWIEYIMEAKDYRARMIAMDALCKIVLLAKLFCPFFDWDTELARAFEAVEENEELKFHLVAGKHRRAFAKIAIGRTHGEMPMLENPFSITIRR